MTLPDRARPPGASRDLAVSLSIFRITREWSQSELAEAAGVTNSAISDYERGKVDPQTQTLLKILRALGLPLSALDDTQSFIVRLRAKMSLEPAGESAETAFSASPAVPAVSPARRALRLQIAEVASEAGRVCSRLVQFVLELLSRDHEAG
jgi:transcriptional regulator with XRE-family HTH domain